MSSTQPSLSGYRYGDAETNASHRYLLPMVLRLVQDVLPQAKGARIFDLGCGNGAVAVMLNAAGYGVSGVDVSDEGIAQARRQRPQLNVAIGSAYDDLSSKYGRFPLVVSLEVVEHLYAPRLYAKTLYNLVEPGGAIIISTPYHGYWKNLALAVTGQMDRHFTALWDHGHIKFWSQQTLSTLLMEAGFSHLWFYRVGRVPALAKSMIVTARKA